MRRAEVADKIEMHSKDLAGTPRDAFKLLAFASAQIGSRGETLKPCHFNVRGPFGTPVNAIRIKCNVSHCVDSFFIGFEVLIDRTSARAAPWGVCHKMQVRFSADRDDGEPGGKPHPAFSLDVFDHRFAFESVEIFTEEQLNSS